MKLNILTFGIARDIIGERVLSMEVRQGIRLHELMVELNRIYPSLLEVIHYSVAVNQEYTNENIELNDTDEIAIIPPVSGG